MRIADDAPSSCANPTFTRQRGESGCGSKPLMYATESRSVCSWVMPTSPSGAGLSFTVDCRSRPEDAASEASAAVSASAPRRANVIFI